MLRTKCYTTKAILSIAMVFILTLWQANALADEFMLLHSSFEDVIEWEGKDYTETSDYSITYSGKERLGHKCSIIYNFKNGIVDSYQIYFEDVDASDYYGSYNKIVADFTDYFGVPKGKTTNMQCGENEYNDNIIKDGNNYATIWDFYKDDNSVLILLITGNKGTSALIGASVEYDPSL